MPWITDQVALAGAEITPGTWPEFNKYEFGAVVNLRSEHQDTFGEPLPQAYLWIPTEDFVSPSPEMLLLSSQFIDNAVKSGLKVLVHCRMGIYRSATAIVAYLMYTGLSKDAAIRQMAVMGGPRLYGSEENHQTLDAYMALLTTRKGQP